MNEVPAISFINVFEINFFKQRLCDVKMAIHQQTNEVFAREASIDKCCNFVTFS